MENFQGYKINSTEVRVVNEILERARIRVMSAQQEQFHLLLSEKIQTMADDISLKIAQPIEQDFLKIAENQLRQEIAFTGRAGYNNDFNFEATVSIVPDTEATYLMLFCPSDFTREAFAGTEGIEDFSIGSDVETSKEEMETRQAKWESLEKANGDGNPLIIKSFLSGPITLDTDLLHFEAVSVRAFARARQNLMNMRLQMFAFGKEIPAPMLMQKLDMVLGTMMDDETQDEMQQIAARIEPLLKTISIKDNTLSFGNLGNSVKE